MPGADIADCVTEAVAAGFRGTQYTISPVCQTHRQSKSLLRGCSAAYKAPCVPGYKGEIRSKPIVLVNHRRYPFRGERVSTMHGALTDLGCPWIASVPHMEYTAAFRISIIVPGAP